MCCCNVYSTTRALLGSELFVSSPSRSDRSGVCAWRLPVRGAEASDRVGARGPVLHGGLQGIQEEPGPGVPLWGWSSALGARAPLFKAPCGQHVSEGKAGSISCHFPVCLNKCCLAEAALLWGLSHVPSHILSIAKTSRTDQLKKPCLNIDYHCSFQSLILRG